MNDVLTATDKQTGDGDSIGYVKENNAGDNHAEERPDTVSIASFLANTLSLHKFGCIQLCANGRECIAHESNISILLDFDFWEPHSS